MGISWWIVWVFFLVVVVDHGCMGLVGHWWWFVAGDGGLWVGDGRLRVSEGGRGEQSGGEGWGEEGRENGVGGYGVECWHGGGDVGGGGWEDGVGEGGEALERRRVGSLEWWCQWGLFFKKILLTERNFLEKVREGKWMK